MAAPTAVATAAAASAASRVGCARARCSTKPAASAPATRCPRPSGRRPRRLDGREAREPAVAVERAARAVTDAEHGVVGHRERSEAALGERRGVGARGEGVGINVGGPQRLCAALRDLIERPRCRQVGRHELCAARQPTQAVERCRRHAAAGSAESCSDGVAASAFSAASTSPPPPPSTMTWSASHDEQSRRAAATP